MSLLVGLGLVAVVFAVVLKVMYLDDVPLRVSRETTILTEPLTADGRVDYVAAAESGRYPPEMETDENGFRLIIQGLGPSLQHTPETRQQIYEKLGLDSNAPPTLAYEQPYRVLERYAQAEETAGNLPANMNANQFLGQLDAKLDDPWTLDEFPMMADWLTQNGPALDLVAEAVRKPVFVIPWAQFDEASLFFSTPGEEIQRMRSFARGFRCRARYRMATGDVDGAIDDIVSCARMGRHLQNGEFMTKKLVGIANEAVAFAIGAGSSLEHQPTEEQWQRLIDELNNLPERETDLICHEVERWMVLSAIQCLARNDPDSEHLLHEEQWNLLQERNYGIDWNIVIERVNERYDEAVAGATITRLDPATLDGFMSRPRRSYLIGEFLAPSFVPSIEQYREVRNRNVCKENILRIVLAMLLYETQHGTLPPAFSVDEQGRPLHSWRVLLLPYLGYDELSANIRLDEPWDSAHNRQFHRADVSIFQCPSPAHGAGMTSYSVVEGPTCAFQGGEGKRLDTFGPRSAHLVLIVERTDAVNWMDPTSELSFADACMGINCPGANGMGSVHEGGVHIGQRSGRVTFISENIKFDNIPRLLEGKIEEPY